MAEYYSILTTRGQALEAESVASGTVIALTEFVVGDSVSANDIKTVTVINPGVDSSAASESAGGVAGDYPGVRVSLAR
ncbi:phage tail protein [Klebsiella aerogenes]|uniref:phage tail-collar fiber domain-containing protein n=1 Tax=Klebsiella aerogenes TaxID=548 RepID=UPI0037B1BD8D